MYNHEVKKYNSILVVNKKLSTREQKIQQLSSFFEEKHQQLNQNKKIMILKKKCFGQRGSKTVKKCLNIPIQHHFSLTKNKPAPLSISLMTQSNNTTQQPKQTKEIHQNKRKQKVLFKKNPKHQTIPLRQKRQCLPCEIRVVKINQRPKIFRINQTANEKKRILETVENTKEEVKCIYSKHKRTKSYQNKRSQFQPWKVAEEESCQF